ncbi:MAG: cadherin repeat domain-containing protein [Candidatus Aminicenantes bacterium]|nr:cadherin repeat domain-containing protein [Candidatus Aminicenantes bacterium]
MNKKNIIILVVFFAALFLVMFLLKRSDVGEIRDKSGRKIVKKKEKPLQIKKVPVEPAKPRSSHVVRVAPELNRKPDGKVTFNYRWFVNGEEIFNLNESILPEQYRRKNNRVYCIVQGFQGDYETKEKKSKEFVIANSPPVVGYQKVKDFSVPGEFYHKINAHDPDGDKIEYSLVSPLGMGVELDPDTGEIRWQIAGIPEVERKVTSEDGSRSYTVKVPDRANARVNIVVQIKDSDGAEKIVSLKLDLATGRDVSHLSY